MSGDDQTVDMVDLRGEQVHMSGGEVVPVVSWWEHGESCDDPFDATHCVAGPDAEGCYWTITILEPAQCQ